MITFKKIVAIQVSCFKKSKWRERIISSTQCHESYDIMSIVDCDIPTSHVTGLTQKPCRSTFYTWYCELFYPW